MVPPNLQQWLLKFRGCGSGVQKPRIRGEFTSDGWDLLVGFHPTFNDGFERSRSVVRVSRNRGAASPGTVSQAFISRRRCQEITRLPVGPDELLYWYIIIHTKHKRMEKQQFMLTAEPPKKHINHFPAPACKISGLKDAQTHLQTVYFSSPVTHLLSMLYVLIKILSHANAKKA